MTAIDNVIVKVTSAFISVIDYIYLLKIDNEIENDHNKKDFVEFL